jgi:acid phosphatase type 7
LNAMRPLHYRLLLAAFVLAATAWGAESPVAAVVPERIVLNLTPAPATSIAVTWRTNAAIPSASVQITKATAEPKLADAARSVAAHSEAVPTDAGTSAWYHSVVIDKLSSATLYAYRVGDGTTWSEWNQFRTANAAAVPFKFLFLGDTQNDIKEYCSRIFRAAFGKSGDSAFYLLAGDLVTATVNDETWGEFFYALDPFDRMVPGLATVGNHEYREFPVGGRPTKTASPLFRAHFTQPTNGLVGLEETNYFVDYQGARFVVLNGSERVAEQAAWLDQLLTKNPNRWTIVLMHQPVYSTGKSRDNPKLRDTMLPVYDKHAVDLVLQGHDHTYGRTFKLHAGHRVADSAPGTVYVVSVAGPKYYPVNPQHADLMARIDSGAQLFQIISIDGDRLRFESWTVTGELHDSFTLTKAPGVEGQTQ